MRLRPFCRRAAVQDMTLRSKSRFPGTDLVSGGGAEACTERKGAGRHGRVTSLALAGRSSGHVRPEVGTTAALRRVSLPAGVVEGMAPRSRRTPGTGAARTLRDGALFKNGRGESTHPSGPVRKDTPGKSADRHDKLVILSGYHGIRTLIFICGAVKVDRLTVLLNHPYFCL